MPRRAFFVGRGYHTRTKCHTPYRVWALSALCNAILTAAVCTLYVCMCVCVCVRCRCIGPFATETLACIQQGVDPIALNKAMMDFGYPVGPVSLLDEVGIRGSHSAHRAVCTHTQCH